MTLQEINSKYSYKDLHCSPGSADLRRELFSPILTGLCQNKIVYYERFACVAVIENVEITPEYFQATTVPYLKLKAGGHVQYYPSKPWTFGAAWSVMRLIDDHFAGYGSWMFWTDKNLVKRVEELAGKGELDAAMNLTLYKNNV